MSKIGKQVHKYNQINIVQFRSNRSKLLLSRITRDLQEGQNLEWLNLKPRNLQRTKPLSHLPSGPLNPLHSDPLIRLHTDLLSQLNRDNLLNQLSKDYQMWLHSNLQHLFHRDLQLKLEIQNRLKTCIKMAKMMNRVNQIYQRTHSHHQQIKTKKGPLQLRPSQELIVSHLVKRPNLTLFHLDNKARNRSRSTIQIRILSREIAGQTQQI